MDTQANNTYLLCVCLHRNICQRALHPSSNCGQVLIVNISKDKLHLPSYYTIRNLPYKPVEMINDK